jgi:hypothetical protein
MCQTICKIICKKCHTICKICIICNWNRYSKYAKNKMQKNMQNMRAVCRFSWYFPILHAICKICKKICTICKICKRHFQYADYALRTLLMLNLFHKTSISKFSDFDIGALRYGKYFDIEVILYRRLLRYRSWNSYTDIKVLYFDNIEDLRYRISSISKISDKYRRSSISRIFEDLRYRRYRSSSISNLKIFDIEVFMKFSISKFSLILSGLARAAQSSGKRMQAAAQYWSH